MIPEVKPAGLLYRTLWRWHFYAGLFCIPFVLALAVTGTIYLFKPQIQAWIDAPYNTLTVEEQAALPNQQIAAALAAVPATTFLKYRLPATPSHAAVITLSRPDGTAVLCYVDPYSLEVLKVIDDDQQFFNQVKRFHGELMAGNTGSVLVELAGNWAIVLILSGLYLWWPRQQRGLGGVLYPRLQLRGRPFWRDVHSTLGVWVSMLALFLLVTGLPWSLVWNAGFKEARTWFEAEPVPQEWTVSRHEEHLANVERGVSRYDLQPAVLASAKALQLAWPAELGIDKRQQNQWLLASDNQNRLLRTQAWLAADTGEVLQLKPYSDRNTLDLAIGIGIAAHEGQLFGWFNQALGLLTALSLMVMSIAGGMLWWKRKPAGRLGSPIPVPDRGIERDVAALMLGMALLLPMLAISLLVLALLEWAVLKRMPGVSAWLGLGGRVDY